MLNSTNTILLDNSFNKSNLNQISICETQILNSAKTQNYNLPIKKTTTKDLLDKDTPKTFIIENSNITQSVMYTKGVSFNHLNNDVIKTKIIENKQNVPETYINDNNQYKILSTLDDIVRDIYIKKKIHEGSFNKIYNISRNKSSNIDNNVLVRILNSNADNDTVENEIKGVEIQYKLCQKSENIGIVVDYGKILQKKIKQDYFIMVKYGLPLTKILNSNIKYKNMEVPIRFMKNLLKTINIIHKNNYAHLDLKPCNIILKNYFTLPKNIINELSFAIIDFGGTKNFKNDKSIKLNEQMASAAFSPPELLNMNFGKKSDIWAYGVICYLLCVRKFFFKANGPSIFMNSDKEKLANQLNIGLSELRNKIVPTYLKKSDEIKDYLFPLENTLILEDFFKKIFIIEPDKRPNTEQLLSHSLFKLFD